MTVTPQTNTDLPSIAALLRTRDDFVICGHVSPDGDCLGSQLALMHALRAIGKRVACLLAQDEPVDTQLSFLPGIDELVPADRYSGFAHTFIAVDVPTRTRIGEAAANLRDACELAVTIDHHAVDVTMSDLIYVDPDAASTTMLIWELAHLLSAERTEGVALCAYTGLVTDTGRFQYQNTDARALYAAAGMVAAGADAALVARNIFQDRTLASVRLETYAIERIRFSGDGSLVLSWVGKDDFDRTGGSRADAEPIIDALRALRGVRVACMLRDQGDTVRGSLRAKDDTDVARIARMFGGGGHRAAAGFTVAGPIEDAIVRVERELARALASDAVASEDAALPLPPTSAEGAHTA